MKLFIRIITLLLVFGNSLMLASAPVSTQQKNDTTSMLDAKHTQELNAAAPSAPLPPAETEDETILDNAACMQKIESALSQRSIWAKARSATLNIPAILKHHDDAIKSLLNTMNNQQAMACGEYTKALFLAVKYNCFEVVQELIMLYPINIFTYDERKNTALDYAQENNNKEMIELISVYIRGKLDQIYAEISLKLQDYFNYFSSPRKINKPATAPNMADLEKDIIDALSIISDRFINVSHKVKPLFPTEENDFKKYTIFLIMAAQYNCFPAIEHLVNKHEFLNYKLLDSSGRTALDWARIHANEKMMKLLQSKWNDGKDEKAMGAQAKQKSIADKALEEKRMVAQREQEERDFQASLEAQAFRMQEARRLKLAQDLEQEKKRLEEQQKIEVRAKRIYEYHLTRPDLILIEDEQVTDYTQWFIDHKENIARIDLCPLCKPKLIDKVAQERERKRIEQLQRRASQQSLLSHRTHAKPKKVIALKASAKPFIPLNNKVQN